MNHRAHIEAAREKRQKWQAAAKHKFRRLRDAEPEEHQRRTAPTGKYSVSQDRGEIKNGRVVRTTQDVERRMSELKIWADLDTAQSGAAMAIYNGYLEIAYPQEVRAMTLEDRVDGGRRPIDPDARIRALDNYRAWLAECHRQNASRSMSICLSVFCMGNNLDEAAALARMSNRKVKPALIEGLDIYCAVNGMKG